MYEGMDVWMCGHLNVWMYGHLNAWMHGCMDVWSYGWICGHMVAHGCMGYNYMRLDLLS